MGSEHDPEIYGKTVADHYDELYGGDSDTAGTVQFLAELAGPGPVCELGIGTGRLALPLLERGLEVHGIESSEAMLAQLRAKPGGAEVPVTVGDFSSVQVTGGPFSMSFLAFNTIFAVASTAAQIACFEMVSRHLRPGGRFVIEAFVLDPLAFHRGRSVEIRTMTARHVELQLTDLDEDQQKLNRVFLNIRDGKVDMHSATDIYAAPRELDLMARIAGLTLAERWSDWNRAPFSARSAKHVSVYAKPEA